MEIGLRVIDTGVARITHKMVMARKEDMTGTVVHGEVLIGMEVECQLETKEGVIGVGLVLMTAQAGSVALHHLTATNFYWCMLVVFSMRNSNAEATLGT